MKTLNIKQTANGFIVNPLPDSHSMAICEDETRVFNKLLPVRGHENLVTFLIEYFESEETFSNKQNLDGLVK